DGIRDLIVTGVQTCALPICLREVAREVGAKPALVLGDRTLTYRELDERTDRLAAALARRGVTQGDRVTLFMPNSLEFVVAFYGEIGRASCRERQVSSGECDS